MIRRININRKLTKIKFEYNDFWPLLNILNEVCNGLNINFEKTIGTTEQAAIDFMDRISQEEGKDEIVFILNDSELSILSNSFAEVLRQIEEWEFQTRIGVSIEEANKIKRKIERL